MCTDRLPDFLRESFIRREKKFTPGKSGKRTRPFLQVKWLMRQEKYDRGNTLTLNEINGQIIRTGE